MVFMLIEKQPIDRWAGGTAEPSESQDMTPDRPVAQWSKVTRPRT